MPRYFFNVYDGIASIDKIGTDFPSLKDAKHEAVRRAGQLLRDNTGSIANGEDWHLETVDKFGLVLFRLDILATDAPVARPDPLMKR
ncbi:MULTISPECIES: hypothetical protein [unclassified Methylobacterium]|uniref:DUF6894 family protein n=1 Tax=unclassified Methylobacterium TaxID=2615210 RepID=UPI0011149FEC|nr:MULTISPECIES: hypothetical protein [unclassified Methylobacterium]